MHFRLLVVLPILRSFSVLMALDAGKTDFSGDWKLNEEKSELPERGRRMLSLTLVIKQKDNVLDVTRTYSGRDGAEYTLEEKLTLDGKESTTTFRESPKTTTVKWSEDRKSLHMVSKMIFSRNGNEFEIDTKEVWKFNSDGELAIDITSTTPRGERQMALVYSKKKAE